MYWKYENRCGNVVACKVFLFLIIQSNKIKILVSDADN